MEKKYKFPKTLGTCADKLYKLRDQKRLAQRVVDAVADEYRALSDHIINTLPKERLSGAQGKVGKVAVIVKEVPQYEDKREFFEYIKKEDRFDLMQGRLSSRAIQDMWEAGEDVPGIMKFNAVSVSLTKAK